MHIEYLEEPFLEFGAGLHLDTRFGLLNLGPLDTSSPSAPHLIRVGLCGTPKTVEGLTSWIEKCKLEIPAKSSPRFNLFPRFPGFSRDGIFGSEVIIEPHEVRTISEKFLNPALTRRNDPSGLDQIVTMFLDELTHIVEGSNVDVLICAPPQELDRGAAIEIESNDEMGENLPTFHNLLKARGVNLHKPLQLIFPATYGIQVPGNRRGNRPLQDEATRAWNFHVALYYKAGGRPWRLVRKPTDFTTCFIGISFYESADQKQLLTSMAQVFNERGHGVIVRGAAPKKSEEDRRPHLEREDAHNLLKSALIQYKIEHHTLPARVVVHKSSHFNEEEIEGFRNSMYDLGIQSGDLVNMDRSWTRLFRKGAYPPLRGTLWITDDGRHFLYTKGSIEFYSAYPGLYVPRPIEFELDWGDDTPKQIEAV
jgi:hypothetical protein